MKRSATRSDGSTEPGSGLRRAFTIRNVVLALLGAAVLVSKSAYHGPGDDAINAYAGNVAVSFALYFAAINATSSYARPRLVAVALTLIAVELFEVTNGLWDPLESTCRHASLSIL